MVIYCASDTDEEVQEDHDCKLVAFLDRCPEQGIKLNKSKLMLRCPVISYLGHQVTSEGLRPDPEKVEAIVKMPPPEDVNGVRSVTFVKCSVFCNQGVTPLSDSTFHPIIVLHAVIVSLIDYAPFLFNRRLPFFIASVPLSPRCLSSLFLRYCYHLRSEIKVSRLSYSIDCFVIFA